MTNESLRDIVLAKAEQMYDTARPGFVHARREPHTREGWTRLTFPSGVVCTTNSSPIETELIYNEVFVSKDYFGPTVRITDHSTIIDVGANVGMFTIYLLTHFKDPCIHAIEPVPETFEVLEENMAQFGDRRVHLYKTAVGDEPDSTIDILVFPMMAGNSTSYPEIKDPQRQAIATIFTPEERAYIYAQKRITVPSTTLSTIIDQESITTVDLLKIDTEGAETCILRGIQTNHWPKIRQVAIEVHNEVKTLPSIVNILSTNGFKATIHEATRDPFGTVVISASRSSTT